MATRQDARARLLPEAARVLRGRDFRSAFSEHLEVRDKHTIILALPDDTMGYVFSQLAAAGGRAVLVTKQGLALMAPASEARVEVAREDDSVAAIHEESQVSMFFEYLRLERNVVIQQVSARLIDESEPLGV